MNTTTYSLTKIFFPMVTLATFITNGLVSDARANNKNKQAKDDGETYPT